MKVIQHTSALLILQERLLGIRLLGGATALFGFFIFIIFAFPFDLFGCFCIAIAAVMATLSPIETCTFNKVNDLIILEKRHWFRRRVQRHRITTIQGIQVEENHWLGTPFYQVKLKFASGYRPALTQFATTDRIAQHSIAERIRDFLDIGHFPSIS
ncbi:MAG: hypothetical protein HC851_08130 [Acaryochloris sp. RU_4_1]|nr:hypothetical protein [Acaryochloris sp. RU_4_1]